MTGLEMIEAERFRQIEQLGHRAADDDLLPPGELARAADCYATPPTFRNFRSDRSTPFRWPWPAEAWRPCPGDRVRELTKAGALYLAQSAKNERAGQLAAAMLYRNRARRMATKIDRLLKGGSDA